MKSRGAEPSHQAGLASQLFDEAVQRHQDGKVAEAEALYRAILVLQPAHAEANYNLGLLLQMQGRPADAALLYQQAIAARPDYVEAYSNLGTLFQDAGLFDRAIEIYRQAIAVRPDNAVAYSNLGTALKEHGECEEAIQAFHRALAIRPDYDAAFANLGAALLEIGETERAIEACRKAVEINPRSTLGYCNLAGAYKSRNELAGAEAAYRRAIASQPDLPEAHFGLAQILFLKGDLPAAWPEYDWRWKLKQYGWLKAIHGTFDQPLWSGEPLDGKTILVYAEQGLGDACQFARFLPELVRRGGKVVFAVHPPLLRLFADMPGVTTVPLDQAPFPPFDIHCPLLTLPRVIGTSVATIPGEIPYLRAKLDETDRWRARLAGTSLRVGIVWAGNPSQRGDRLRSPRLKAMRPLLNIPGIRFVALQLGAGRQDLELCALPPDVLDPTPEIRDLADTAAILSGLDLLITSCTAALHLAGALGIPTWAAIPYAPHFFWQLERSDTPWYRTVKLYRQGRPGRDWSDVVDQMGRDLAALAATRAADAA